MCIGTRLMAPALQGWVLTAKDCEAFPGIYECSISIYTSSTDSERLDWLLCY